MPSPRPSVTEPSATLTRAQGLSRSMEKAITADLPGLPQARQCPCVPLTSLMNSASFLLLLTLVSVLQPKGCRPCKGGTRTASPHSQAQVRQASVCSLSGDLTGTRDMSTNPNIH